MVNSSAWTFFDRLGVSVSFVCGIHCLAMPILLPLIPLLAGSFWIGDAAESWVMTITILVAAPALFRGYLLHRKFRVVFIFLLGLMFLLLKSDNCVNGENGHIHLNFDNFIHYAMAAFGGFSLAIGHWLNLKFCKSCPSCKEVSKGLDLKCH